MKHTVESLRKSGHKVRVTHYRHYQKRPFERQDKNLYRQNEMDYWLIGPRGGKTVVEILTPDGQERYGESICSIKDAYVKKFGVQKALNRAMGVEEPAKLF